ncbi:ImmA/IrrE family metallo-endopeptidase [Phaeobacter sp. LSS9]|uniref:ImmA/IrrE family metallo-endopeptidase n=1 Tax=unclassified Phaeobacter TaxID=2621772 RepID=UPI0019686E6F|nr:ImmA/IrrE family metallo-endopeptidase [Phaeobacter sp. LSS9]
MNYRPNYARVKSQVRSIREEFGISSPPVNPVEVARNMGVEVRFVGFNEDFQNVSGFYDPDENAIYVNKDEFPLRQTFTIAHELGHALLHRDWAMGEDYRVLMRDDETDHGEPHEKEANAFAAHLLVPRDMLDEYSSLTPQDLSRLFAVSLPVIKHRLSFEYGS